MNVWEVLIYSAQKIVGTGIISFAEDILSHWELEFSLIVETMKRIKKKCSPCPIIMDRSFGSQEVQL